MPVAKSVEIHLLRHGHSSANGLGILAGRDNSVKLSDRGIAQAESLIPVLRENEYDLVLSSPIFRCQETLYPFLESTASQRIQAELRLEDRLQEMDYGDWSGKKLSALSKKPLWKTIQGRPSIVRFPNGESFAQMSERVNSALHDILNTGAKRVLVCSHGDVIKAIIAQALGLHLDQFQRIIIDPASISAIQMSAEGAHVIKVNDTSHLPKSAAPTKSKKRGPLLGGGGGK
jgi:probable phosphomutase (TIGR03848 family)